MATQRRLPKVSELMEFVPGVPSLPTNRNAVARAGDLADLRRIAKRRAPAMVFDYVDGAAEQESSADRAREAFDRVTFRPRVLRNVGQIDPSAEIFGRKVGMPLVLGPTGFTRMMHQAGESAVAVAAQKAGVPYALSTMGTTSARDVRDAAPTGWNWFQMYVLKQREVIMERLSMAQDSGMDVLVVTVDTAVAGNRLRDVRHGMTIPPTIRWSQIPAMATHPAWLADFLTTEPLAFTTAGGDANNIADIAKSMFDPTVNFDDLAWMRDKWNGKLVIKGVQDVTDAQKLAEIGVDGIVISCHGGRQLDRAPVPLETLPEMRASVGDDMHLFLDGGVRSGSDVAAAVALGADACFVGRAYLYGLMAAGQFGVEKMLSLFHDEYVRTLALLGLTSTDQLTIEAVKVRDAAVRS